MDETDELYAPVIFFQNCSEEDVARVECFVESRMREKVLFPTHVVTGKMAVLVFREASLTNHSGASLKPGTKVECVCQVDGALKVDAAIAGHGWISMDQVRLLPASKIAGTCRCCDTALPPASFSKTSCGLLQKGQRASCTACQNSALSEAARSHLVSALASLVREVEAQKWCAFVGVAAERLSVALKKSICLDWAGFVASAAAWWLWVWAVLQQRKKEPDLTKKPLQLVADPLLLDGKLHSWQQCIWSSETRSFASLLRNPFRDDDLARWWEAAASMKFWQQPDLGNEVLLPRQAAWFVRRGCTCSYEYGATFWPALEMPEWLLQIEEAVWETINLGLDGSRRIQAPNSCVLNFYLDGSHFVDWHADDERLFEGVRRDSLIVSLSLGASRHFEMRRRQAFGPHRPHVAIELSSGDIVTMEGLFQKYWQHRIPRCSKAGPRINMTWRTITAHCQACPFACALDN